MLVGSVYEAVHFPKVEPRVVVHLGARKVMQQRQPVPETNGLGVSLPVFLGIWLVCAVIAGFVWQDLVANTNNQAQQLSISVSAMFVLSITFGLPGAGLVCFAWSILREP